jgi:hypothetical protein
LIDFAPELNNATHTTIWGGFWGLC